MSADHAGLVVGNLFIATKFKIVLRISVLPVCRHRTWKFGALSKRFCTTGSPPARACRVIVSTFKVKLHIRCRLCIDCRSTPFAVGLMSKTSLCLPGRRYLGRREDEKLSPSRLTKVWGVQEDKPRLRHLASTQDQIPGLIDAQVPSSRSLVVKNLTKRTIGAMRPLPND